MTDLQKFISSIKTGGLSISNRYTVMFNRPKTLNNLYSNIELVSLYCETAHIPGFNYATVPNRSYGETRESPYERMFHTTSFIFYLDTDMVIKTFFDNWVLSIQNPTTKVFSYYNDYVTDIQLNVEDRQSNTTYTVKFYECYPKGISEIKLNYADKDIMKLHVDMVYKYWEPISLPIPIIQNNDFNYTKNANPLNVKI